MAVSAHAEERDNARLVAAHLRGEAPASGDELGRLELVGARGRATDQVRDSIALLEEEVLFPGPEASRREAAGVQRRPEAVAGAREVVAGGGGVKPGVD